MSKIVKSVAVVLLATFVSACASFGLVEGVKPETVAQRVLAAEADYYVQFAAMAEYEGLPRCENANAPTFCSKQSVVDKLRLVDNRYVNARDLAWNVVRSVDPDRDTVDNAIQALTAVVADATKIVLELKNEGVL